MRNTMGKWCTKMAIRSTENRTIVAGAHAENAQQQKAVVETIKRQGHTQLLDMELSGVMCNYKTHNHIRGFSDPDNNLAGNVAKFQCIQDVHVGGQQGL